MVNGFYYNNNEYVPRSKSSAELGYLASTLVSGAIISTLPLFGKPIERQLLKDQSKNHLYKDAFERAIEVAGLDKHGVSLVKGQIYHKGDDVAKGFNAFYNPANKEIHINTDKISIAGFHEVGHAMNHLTGKFGKLLNKSRMPGMYLAGLLETIAVFSSPKPAEAPKNLYDKIKDNCGKLAFLCWMPVVLEEGLASYNGIQLAKKCGLNKTLVNNMKKMCGKAWLTYVAKAIITGLSVGASNIIMQRFTRPKKIETNDTFLENIIYK